MAKNDYFPLVYKILKYLYECLKSGKQPNLDLLSDDYLNVEHSYWSFIFENLVKDGYVSGVRAFYVMGNSSKVVKLSPSIQITPKGIEYLGENSSIKKVVNAVKDISDMIPL